MPALDQSEGFKTVQDRQIISTMKSMSITLTSLHARKRVEQFNCTVCTLLLLLYLAFAGASLHLETENIHYYDEVFNVIVLYMHKG